MFFRLLLFVVAHCGTPGPVVRVEVRSGSVVKLFPGRSLHLRALRAYREYSCSRGLSEEATEGTLRAVLQHEVTRQRELRYEAEQQKQADAFRRETLWLALDLRGAFTAIGKSLHPRVFGAFFGWRQQYLAAKHARS